MTTEPGKRPVRLIDSELRSVLDDIVIRSDLSGYPGRNIREHIAALEAELADWKQLAVARWTGIVVCSKEKKELESALSASQARAEKAEATLRDALVVLAGCKVGTPAEGFIEAPIGELGWCIRKVRDERDSLRTELAPAKGRAAPVTEPLVDAFQELGLVPGASLTDKGETK